MLVPECLLEPAELHAICGEDAHLRHSKCGDGGRRAEEQEGGMGVDECSQKRCRFQWWYWVPSPDLQHTCGLPGELQLQALTFKQGRRQNN